MAYATQADMEIKYGEKDLIELSDRAFTGEIASAVIEAALADAAALIDGYVGKRYQVPVMPVPSLLNRLAMVIAYYELHNGRYSDQVRAAYDDALRTLANISGGIMTLPVAGTTSEAESAAAEVVYDMAPRQFSRKKGDW